MELNVSRSFNSIYDDWARLYRITPEVSPFLEPHTMRLAVRYFYPYYFTRRCTPHFVIFQDNDLIRAIAPMLRYPPPDNRMELFGFANGFNESGMVFDSESIIPECLSLLKEKYSNIEFLKIDERSPLAKYIPREAERTSNAAINFGKDFESYFTSLSKSVRQNIRTAYNRLKADNLTYELRVFCGDDSLPIKDILSLYCRRHETKYGVKTSLLKKWFLKSQNFATRFYRYSPNALTFVLYINDCPAAFLSGLSAHDRLIVPRLSIDESFRRYSPGMLLVIETIKSLINTTEIEVLDLSRGKESYKYNLGAEEHFSYRFNL